MKLKISKEELMNNIDIIQNIVNIKSSLPILSNILIEATQDKLRLTATDLNIGISCVMPVDCLEPGSITVPAKRLGSIIRELPGEEVEITTKKNNMMLIETKLCQFKIMGLPSEDFPKLPEIKDKEALVMEQATLKEMLILTSFAVSWDESKYILNGIFFKITNNILTLVATDAKRLAIVERKLQGSVSKDLHFIVPIKTIQELARNLKEEGSVSLVIGANQALFDLGAVTIISRLTEGEFPSYEQVIPVVSENKIKIERTQFLLAIKRAALLSTPDYQAVKLEAFKNKLVISKSTPDIGESREDLVVDYTGKEMVIGFNPVYLIDVLKNLAEDNVELEVTGPESPGVIRSKGYLYIVLPMRLA